jgi:pentatricopeptide repeat protein
VSVEEPQAELLGCLRRDGNLPREAFDLFHDLCRAGCRASPDRPSSISPCPSIAPSASRVFARMQIFSPSGRSFAEAGRQTGPRGFANQARRGCTPTLFPASLGLRRCRRLRLQRFEVLYL